MVKEKPPLAILKYSLDHSCEQVIDDNGTELEFLKMNSATNWKGQKTKINQR